MQWEQRYGSLENTQKRAFLQIHVTQIQTCIPVSGDHQSN
jgi:hypothetical protein